MKEIEAGMAVAPEQYSRARPVMKSKPEGGADETSRDFQDGHLRLRIVIIFARAVG
jgi:hypothetical protein